MNLRGLNAADHEAARPRVTLTPAQLAFADDISRGRWLWNRRHGQPDMNKETGDAPAGLDLRGTRGECAACLFLCERPEDHVKVLDGPDPGFDIRLPSTHTVDAKTPGEPWHNLLVPQNRAAPRYLDADFAVLILPVQSSAATFTFGGWVSAEEFRARAVLVLPKRPALMMKQASLHPLQSFPF